MLPCVPAPPVWIGLIRGHLVRAILALLVHHLSLAGVTLSRRRLNELARLTRVPHLPEETPSRVLPLAGPGSAAGVELGRYLSRLGDERLRPTPSVAAMQRLQKEPFRQYWIIIHGWGPLKAWRHEMESIRAALI